MAAINKKVFSLDDFKKKHSTTTKYKPDTFLSCGKAFQEASGMPGPAMGHINMLLGHTNTGKAQPLTANILTPNGWVKMGDLCVNDLICGKDGLPQDVVGVFPQGERKVYEVTTNDGCITRCDAEHLWAINTYNQRHSKTSKKVDGKRQYKPDNTYRVVNTLELIELMNSNSNKNIRIPVNEPIVFNETKTPLIIDPYVLGCILGDGYIPSGDDVVRLSTKDDEILNYIENTEHFSNMKVRTRMFDRYSDSDVLVVERELISITFTNETKKSLTVLGLNGAKSDTKFIPEMYLYSSLAHRIELLQGLMDTDGYVDTRGVFDYVTVSTQLRDGFITLVRSLGGVATFTTKETKFRYKNELKTGKDAYVIRFRLPNAIKPFKLNRKLNRLNFERKAPIRYIKNIQYIGTDNCQCIKVSNDDSLYITDDYIVTHNTTGLIAAAVSAQKQGILPIFVITEKKWSFEHCKLMGFDVEKNEDGEWVGDFIYRDDFDYVEQATDFINDMLDKQAKDELPMDICIFWDSVGSIPCKMTFEGKGGKQHTAGVLAEKINMGINQKINNTRKETSKHLAGLVICNLPWVKLPDNPFGQPKIKPKGGEAVYQASTLVFRFGNEADGGISKIDATKNGRSINFATRSKITVDKNHINGLGYIDSHIIVTPHGFITTEKRDEKEALNKYKLETADYWGSKLDGLDFELEEYEVKSSVENTDID